MAFIQVPTDGTGKQVETFTPGTTHRQAVVITGDAAVGEVVKVGGGVEAGALRVTLANDSTGLVSVDDNGSTLSVDDGAGSITVDGTVTANLSGTQPNASHTRNEVFSEAVAVGGELDDTTPVDATEGNVSPLRITAKRGAHVNLRKNDGTELGTLTDPVRTDPTGTTTQPVSGTVNIGTFPDNEPFNLNQLAGTALAAPFDLDSGAGTQNVQGVSLRKAASGGSVELGTSTDPVRVDPTGTTTQPVSGTVTVTHPQLGGGTEAGAQRVTIANDSTGLLSVDDNGGSLTVDNAALSVVGGGAEATALRVTIANDSTGLVSVDDGAGSLTVDGTVTANLGGTQMNASHTRNEAFGEAVAVGGELDDTAPVAATEGNVSPARITAQRALHANLRNNAGTELGTSTDPVRTDPTGTTTQPVSGTVNIGTFPDNEPFNVAQIAGTATSVNSGGPDAGSQRVVVAAPAHDAADSGNPIKIGGKANLNEPTAVADADRVDAWFDQLGRLVVLAGHANPEPPVTANPTASGNNTIIAAPGVSLSLYICKGSVHNSGASPIVVILQDGAAGTNRWAAELAADGGGSLFDFGDRGWKLTANTLLNANLSAAGDVRVNVSEYYVAA